MDFDGYCHEKGFPPLNDAFETPWPGLATAGTASLGFANTLDWRLRETPVELLRRYEDLARWGRTAGAFAPAQARSLRAWAARRPAEADAALRRARAIREDLAAILGALAMERRPDRDALAGLERALRLAQRERRLVAGEAGARWDWRDGAPSPLRPALAAALDTERLLTGADAARVRQCGDAECGWFFLDHSRNASRRWCSMRACGNRNKARRHRARAARG